MDWEGWVDLEGFGKEVEDEALFHGSDAVAVIAGFELFTVAGKLSLSISNALHGYAFSF